MDAAKKLREEEKLAYDTPLTSRIHQVKLPPQSIQELEAEINSCHIKYGNLFPSYEDAEYFSMLPLTDETRRAVLQRAQVLEQERRTHQAKWDE